MDLSAETLQARREWQDIIEVQKEKNLQPRLLYSAKISFKIDGEIKSFTDKQKLREFSTTKPAMQQILKGLTQPVNTRERKDLQKQTQNNQENASRNTCINNYLKCKWIECTNQKIKQDPYIYCLQETHFRPRDTYRLKVKGWKKIFHANGNQKKARVAILISD